MNYARQRAVKRWCNSCKHLRGIGRSEGTCTLKGKKMPTNGTCEDWKKETRRR